MHSKSFCCSLSMQWAEQRRHPFLLKLVPAFPSSLYTPCHLQRKFTTDQPWQSTSLSISHFVVKRVLGAATFHRTEYCPLIGPQYPVCRPATEYSINQALPSVWKWASSRDYLKILATTTINLVTRSTRKSCNTIVSNNLIDSAIIPTEPTSLLFLSVH